MQQVLKEPQEPKVLLALKVLLAPKVPPDHKVQQEPRVLLV